MRQTGSQRQAAQALLKERGIVRLAELRAAGITAATMSRMERDGEVLRLARGLYQLPDSPLRGPAAPSQNPRLHQTGSPGGLRRPVTCH